MIEIKPTNVRDFKLANCMGCGKHFAANELIDIKSGPKPNFIHNILRLCKFCEYELAVKISNKIVKGIDGNKCEPG